MEYFWDDPAVEGDEEIAKLGYAAECWENLQHQEKLVLIGGFSRDLSDLPAANPSLEPPKIRASEVVGRESLKAFVREARDCYDGLLKRSRQNTSAQLEVILQIAALFRREGGYWKSGSTYIFIVTREGFVVFHGANQSYEGRTLLDVEDINGVKVVRELIAAADAGGGFVEYYMDDPSVEGDEDTGSPKVGYAMSFNSQAGRPFIIGSGFYAGESTSLCH